MSACQPFSFSLGLSSVPPVPSANKESSLVTYDYNDDTKTANNFIYIYKHCICVVQVPQAAQSAKLH